MAAVISGSLIECQNVWIQSLDPNCLQRLSVGDKNDLKVTSNSNRNCCNLERLLQRERVKCFKITFTSKIDAFQCRKSDVNNLIVGDPENGKKVAGK